MWIGTTVFGSLECMFDRLDACLGKSIGLGGNADLRSSCDKPQDIQKSVTWALAYCGTLSERRTLGMPCSENISFSSETTLLALLWPGGRCIELRSSSSRSHPLPGGQFLLACEDICGTHLPMGARWCGCWCEGCCSILALEPGAGFTLCRLLLWWPCWCWARRNFHVRATVTLLFPDGIGAVDAGFSPFWWEEWHECFTLQD